MSRFAILLFLLAAIGCGGSDPTTSGGPPMAGPPVGTSSGNAVFDKHCFGCHAFASGSASGPPKSGPNLSTVGSKRDTGWIADHVKKPQTHNTGSKMPEFDKKLSAEEVKSVTDFLAGLK